MNQTPSTDREKCTSALILTDDRATPASKTSRFLALSLKRMGCRAFVRDTSDVRSLFSILEKANLPKHIGASKTIHLDRFKLFSNLAGIDVVLSLDLHWLFTPEPFVSLERIQKIASIWFDDIRTACTSSDSAVPEDRTFQETIRHEKVHHFFYGPAQMEEARILGLPNLHLSRLAAPAEYLVEEHPCLYPDKFAFIGNPGIPTPPSEAVRKLLQKKADLPELRRAAAAEILGDTLIHKWSKLHPEVSKLLAAAIEAKTVTPFRSSLHLLTEAGRDYPDALQNLNESGEILDVALCVKMVTRYDRPALAARFYNLGLADIYSAPWEWEPYGVKARPLVNFFDLPKTYQSYIAHLNGANAARDATANEKLFEIAACGRTSFNVASPDILDAFASPSEIFAADSLDEIESRAVELLKEPERLLEMGEHAKKRVEQEHTWDHRLKTLWETLS